MTIWRKFSRCTAKIPATCKSSRQANLLFGNLKRHRDQLRARGWRFGRARVAVRAADNAKGGGCVRCGFCLYGCPYGCIYNSADTVRELRAEKNFTYQRDVIVTKLRENSEKVFIEGFHRETRAPLSFEADRVYLAAGVIPTAQILLRSQNAYDQPLTLARQPVFSFSAPARAAHARCADRGALHVEPVVHRTEQPANQPPQRASANLHLQRHHRPGRPQIARPAENVRAPSWKNAWSSCKAICTPTNPRRLK